MNFFSNLWSSSKMKDDDSQEQEAEDTPKGENKAKEKKEPEWKKYETMNLKEKRKLYRCRDDFMLLKDIETWKDYFLGQTYFFHTRVAKPDHNDCAFPFNDELNDKVSLWRGDITRLEIDAIVNAANETLLGGGGVDGCIHRAAGPSLKKECSLLDGCETGQAKLTSGHKLPAKYILHTVGPVGEKEDKLESCYKSCLELCLKHEIRTVAFCCISTGIYGYPNKSAAEVALNTTRIWLEKNKDAVDRIIFCLFLDVDIDIYHSLVLKYFPPSPASTSPPASTSLPDLPSLPPSPPPLTSSPDQTQRNDKDGEDTLQQASKKPKHDDENKTSSHKEDKPQEQKSTAPETSPTEENPKTTDSIDSDIGMETSATTPNKEEIESPNEENPISTDSTDIRMETAVTPDKEKIKPPGENTENTMECQ